MIFAYKILRIFFYFFHTQWMEDYHNGQNTQHVQKHVVKEHNTDHEDVIILHLNMVGKIVQMLSKKTENAK